MTMSAFSFLNNTFASSREPMQTLGGNIENENLADKTIEPQNIGGQAVLEGIMMRNKDHYALAIKLSDNSIYVERKKWYIFSKSPLAKKAFFRGFPLLIETLINGVRTLNRSAEITSKDDEEPITPMQLTITLIIALFMAIGLFIVLPHGLTYLMEVFGFSGSVDSFSFQIWDGLFKFLIFFTYLVLITLLPEIRRVFQFHGAEHKVISAYENVPTGASVDINLAKLQSRLHPRCGTTFLLFVLSIAIIMHTVALPLALWIWKPQAVLVTHAYTLIIKIMLMIPISALAYELIRLAARLNSPLGTLLKLPGMALQLLTTTEPDDEHLDVALIALKVALDKEAKCPIITKEFTISE